jgi:hypothetical protein
VTAETSEKTGAFTDSDREMLADAHRILAAVEPYLPLIDKAARLLDNPAARWRRNHGKPPG